MLLQPFLDTISNTDPGKIYVENVRSFFHIPRRLAKLLCEMAVREKLFEKRIGIVCSNSNCKRIIQSFLPNEEIPEEITCSVCEADEEVISSFKTKDLERIVFYKLIK